MGASAAHVALILASLQAAPPVAPSPGAAPSPQASPLREIGHVRASSTCDALGSVILPAALSVAANDRDFRALGTPITRFAAGKGTSFDPNQNPALAADPTLPDDVDAEGDDANTYTPSRTMAASNIDRLAGEILTNVASAQRTLNKAAAAQPDPTVAALRTRLDTILELQRLLAFRLSDVAGLYFSNVGLAQSNPKSSSLLPGSTRAAYQRALSAAIDDQVAGDVSASANGADAEAAIPGNDAASLRNGTPEQIATGLRVQKLILSLDVAHVAADCSARATSPSPSPSPIPSP